jgi:hypothetical protein
MAQKLTNEIITAAIAGFEGQKAHIDSQIAELRATLDGGSSETSAHAATSEAVPRTRKKFSAAAIKRMKEAQQRRWAKVRGESGPPAPTVTPEPPKARRKLSAAGRKAIVAATKRRWALKRAEDAAKAKPAATKKTASKKAAVKKFAAKRTAAKKTATAQAATEATAQ